MTIDPLEDHVDEGGELGAPRVVGRRAPADDVFPDPTAGMVLHRTLAMAARTFLLNDLGDELDDEGRSTATVDALHLSMGTRPLWAQSAVDSLRGTERRPDETERIHQTRVSMRRIRSNLRTFRLLLDPGWGTALRAELAWYGNELGRSRDLDLLADVVAERGPDVLDATEVARMASVITWRRTEVAADLVTDRAGPRRFHLTEQMMVLWEGPGFRNKATRPATEVLPAMLHRSWHDLRGAARKARKVAKSAERLQSKLGDLHDAVFSIGWLDSLATEQPDLADAAQRLIAVQHDVADQARRGWKRDLKDVERRWRRWQG